MHVRQLAHPFIWDTRTSTSSISLGSKLLAIQASTATRPSIHPFFLASMFKRFQNDQTEVNDLLALLTPLIPDADEENCDAIRELVRDDVNELVEEAGWLASKWGESENRRKAKFYLQNW